MLTIRVIHGRNTKEEWEVIEEARSVQLRPAKESQSGHPCVSFWDAAGKCTDVFDGDVYVMNENGSTIAGYKLDYPN